MLRQTMLLSSWAMRSIPHRPAGSLTTAVATAAAVGVLVALLSLGEGLHDWAVGGARADRAVIFSRGAPGPAVSVISRDALGRIASLPQVRRGAGGRPLASGDVTVPVYVEDRRGQRGTVYVVGLTDRAVFPEIHIVSGHSARAGLHELLVSAAAQRRMRGLQIGGRLRIRDESWLVVGAFVDPSRHFDQDLVTDADTLLAALGRNSFEEVVVVLSSTALSSQFRESVQSDPTLRADVHSETAVREASVAELRGFLDFVSYFIGAILAAAAVCAAASGLYSAVDARRRELATLRGVGFGGLPVLASILAEGMVVCVFAAAAGALLARAAFDGRIVTTHDLTFPLSVGTRQMVTAGMWALAIALIAGAIPGIRASRIPVATAMRSR
jgi:putative ABC transport system permease protein